MVVHGTRLRCLGTPDSAPCVLREGSTRIQPQAPLFGSIGLNPGTRAQEQADIVTRAPYRGLSQVDEALAHCLECGLRAGLQVQLGQDGAHVRAQVRSLMRGWVPVSLLSP